jgi:hypothetical protein
MQKLAGAKTRIDEQLANIKVFKSEIAKLESDRGLKAPLLQIGVDIRLRKLEHARETLLEPP